MEDYENIDYTLISNYLFLVTTSSIVDSSVFAAPPAAGAGRSLSAGSW